MPGGFGRGFGRGFSHSFSEIVSGAIAFDDLVGAVIETPSGVIPPEALGSVLGIFDYEITREINAIGRFRVVLGVHDRLSRMLRRGWRISIVEESADPAHPPFLMHRGIIGNRRFVGEAGGIAVLEITGLFKTARHTYRTTHMGLTFSTTPGAVANALLVDETITAPITDAGVLTITFNEQTMYAALLKVAEYANWNIRETYDEDALEFVRMFSVPDSGYTLTHVEGSPVNLQDVHEMGIALIQESPTFSYNGDNIVTKIIPFGSDTIVSPDDPTNTEQAPLTLEASTKTGPFTIQSALNPDGSTYWFIEDTAATALYSVPGEPIELYLKRTDIKNPNADGASRTKAANALYLVTANEMLSRRSEMLELDAGVVNGRQIWSLPGDRMKVVYHGRVMTPDGLESYGNLNRHMLIVSRTDKRGEGGTREVSFVFTAPAFPIVNPDLPDEIIIPPPPDYAPDNKDAAPGDFEKAMEDIAAGEEPSSESPFSQCCDDPTTDVEEVPDEELPEEVEYEEEDPPGTIPLSPPPLGIIIPPTLRVPSFSVVGNGVEIDSAIGGVIFAFHHGISSQPDPASAFIGSWTLLFEEEVNAEIPAHPESPYFIFDPTPPNKVAVWAGVVPPGSNFTYDGSGIGAEIFAEGADPDDPSGSFVSSFVSVNALNSVELAYGTLAHPESSKLLGFSASNYTGGVSLTTSSFMSPFGAFHYLIQGTQGETGAWQWTKLDQDLGSAYNEIKWGGLGFEVNGEPI